jgi:hypothetical protein
MDIATDEIEFGYWPARQLRGLIPPAIRSPDEFQGGDCLNIACTQTALSPARQRALVREWCSQLPRFKVKTLVFSSKVSQELFDAACAISGLDALSVKWSSIGSLEALSGAGALRALRLGSSPAVESLAPLARLGALEHLFIEGVPGPVDLSSIGSLTTLREFGLSAVRGRKISVQTLAPLGRLRRLEMLWLISVRVLEGGLEPLYALRKLASLRTTMNEQSKEFQALCAAVPSLRHFRRVG